MATQMRRAGDSNPASESIVERARGASLARGDIAGHPCLGSSAEAPPRSRLNTPGVRHFLFGIQGRPLKSCRCKSQRAGPMRHSARARSLDIRVA